MKKRILLFLGLSAWFAAGGGQPGWAQEAQTVQSVQPQLAQAQMRSMPQKNVLSLESAVEAALVNNYGQKILEVSRQSAAEEVAQAKRNLAPDVSASLSQGISNQNNSGSYNLNASAVLWSGGQGMNAIRRSKVALSQSDSKLAQGQNDLVINVIQAFLAVLMNEELYKHQSDVAVISREQMQQGEIKYKSGQILESDYLLLKAQAESDNYALTESRVNRDNALLELKTLLCLPAGEEVEVAVPTDFSLETLRAPSLEEFISQTLAWLPDLKIASQNIELARLDQKIAKGALAPTLSLGGSVGTGYNSTSQGNWGNQFTNNNLNQLSLSVSIPLWSKGKARSQVKQAEYQLEQANLQARQTELNIRNSLEKEYLNVVSYREKYLAARTSRSAYEETFKTFSVQFEAGSVSTTDLLQQQNNYLSALNNYIQSKYSYLLNRKVLDVYMGKEIGI